MSSRQICLSRPQEMLLFFTSWRNRVVLDVPVRTRKDPGECFFSAFSRTEPATTKKCEGHPGQRADVPRGFFPLRARGPAWAQT